MTDGLWFRPPANGLGRTPIGWQGWLVTGLGAAAAAAMTILVLARLWPSPGWGPPLHPALQTLQRRTPRPRAIDGSTAPGRQGRVRRRPAPGIS